MYEVLRRKGTIRPIFSIVVDTSIDTFESFDKVLDLLQKDQKYTHHSYTGDINGEADPREDAILKLYGN